MQICQYCHKEYEWDGVKIHKVEGKKRGYNAKKWCSYACKIKESKEKEYRTNLETYGVKTLLHTPETREKVKQTCLKKYGVHAVTLSKNFLEKSKQTHLRKYGREHFTNPEKTALTNLERYGHKSNFISQKEQILQTNLERYGASYPSQCFEVQQKIKQTNKERFGTE